MANRFYYQISIPIKDALILSSCPEREVRQQWIQLIIDHDGRPGEEGGIEAWLRLGEAMGVKREDLVGQRFLLPGVRFAVDAYVSFCRFRPWLEAVAASLTEMFAPLIVQERLSAMLSHYKWVDPAGLQYFKNRLTQAPRDAEYALGLVTERFRTPEEQERAVAALEFKCDVLWCLLDAVERGPIPGTAPVTAAGRPTVPRLHPKARLQHDDVRGRDVLLYPEGLVALNPTGAEILVLCDGVRSVADVVAALEQRYGSPEGGVERDVTAFLNGLAAKGLVTYGP